MSISVLLVLVTAGAQAQPAINLVPNSGFEEGDGATPAGWESQAPFSKTFRASGYFTTGKDAPRNVVFERDESVRRSGRWSGHIRVVNGLKQQGTACWVGPFVPVDPTRRYVFRLYCRTRDTRYAFANIFEYDQAGGLVSSRLFLHPKMTIGSFDAWQEKTYVLYPDMWNPETAKVRVTLNVTSDTGKTSDAWFDDVSLMRFEPEDVPAIRRAIDDSAPPDQVAAYRRRNILFHASFDGKDYKADADFAEGLREPLQSQEIRFGPGRVGGAVQVTEPQGMLIYRAPRNFFPQRGAVAFWFKPMKERTSVFNVTSAEYTRFRGLFRIRHGGEGLSVRMTEAWGRDHSVGLGHRDAWRRGDWNHVVVAWDQNFGMRSYLNGKPAQKATWGRDAWDDNAHGVEISLGSVRHRACLHAFWLDELYIFSVPLTEQEAAGLHAGRMQNVGVRETPSRLSPSDVARRLKSAGIDERTHLPLLAATPKPSLKHVCVRALRARTAKQQTTTVRFALDGLEGSFWPYPYLRGTTLDVFLEKPTALNYIEFTGVGRPFKASAGRTVLAESKDGDLICRRLLDQTIHTDVLRFETPVHDRFHLSEIRLAEIGRQSVKAGPGELVLTLARLAKLEDFGYLKREPLDMWKRRFHQYVCFGQEIGSTARHIAGVCAMGDRNLLVAELGDGGASQALELAPLQQVQIFSPDFGKQTPVDAMTLRLRVSGLAEEEVLRLRVRQPCDVYRNVLKMDFRVRNPTGPDQAVWIELTADVPDQVILPGERWWVEVALAKGGTIHCGRGGSQLVLSCPDPVKSRREFVADQIKLVHSHYRADSEPHPWDSFSWTVTGRRFRFTSESLYLALRAALAVDPANETALAYWHRTHYTFPDRKLDLEPKEAPEWALLQRELLRGITRIIHWWIDNRQMPDGNLGGGWGDDVETASNWPCVALISGDEKVKQGLERIADGVWNNPKEVDPQIGYAVRSMDVEHAAEPTTCSQPHMMLLRYGDPEFIERNMRTAHSVGNLWLGVNPQGERLFRSYMYNARRLSVGGYHACDVPYNSVPMRAVNYIAWYNRNPSALQWAREWTETWLRKCLSTDDGKPAGVVPLEIVFATGKISGFSGHWSKSVYRGGVTGVLHQFLSAYCLTGDRKFLDFLIKYGRYRTDFCRTLIGEPQWPTAEQQKERNGRLRALLKNLLDTELLVTWAEPSTDRIRLPGLGAVSQGYLGHGPFRGAFPTMAASYEGGGEDFCAQVLDNTPTRLRIWLYNFKTTPLRMAARVWFLQAGDYRVRLGPDANSDGRPDRITRTEELPLERYSRIEFELPPRQQVVLTADQLRPQQQAGLRADLGIGPRDLRHDAKSGTLHVTVHNLGARDAENVQVRLVAADGNTLGETTLATLPAPLDMQPKTQTIAFRLTSAQARTGCTVFLDPDDRVRETTEVNNSIAWRGRTP